MISIVVVSHSRALAQAAVELANQMVAENRPQIAIAAGLDDGTFGTDAAAIANTITKVATDDGVLVLIDLGSALLSSELAVEFLDPELAKKVRITPAPLVEGLLSATVSAATGATLAAVEAEARQALIAKQAQLDDQTKPDTPQLLEVPRKKKPANNRITWRTTVRNPHGIHIRPAAAIVTTLRDYDAEVQLSNATLGIGPVPADSLSRITTLQIQQGHILQARISGPQAKAARDALSDLAANAFGEQLDGKKVQLNLAANTGTTCKTPAAKPAPAAERMCVIGPITKRTTRPTTAGYHPQTPKIELQRFSMAAAQVSAYLEQLAAIGSGVPGIIEAQHTMINDRELHHDIVSRITEGFAATDAVDEYLTRQARSFDVLNDEYLRERGQDIRSLRRLLLLALMGSPLDSAAGPDSPGIWLVDELDAASAVLLDPRICLGVITISGGAYGHGVLSARARGIPVLSGYPQAAELDDGGKVAFDPVSREFWLDPSQDVIEDLQNRNASRRHQAEQALKYAHQPALTKAGKRILIEANVGSLADAQLAAEAGAEGFGILRTELLFATQPTPPSVEFQLENYLAIGKLVDGACTIRTWDAGADKPLPFIKHISEPNPALGERGIRAMARRPDIFTDQLRAILLAGKEIPVKILLPMVTDPAEVAWTRRLLAELHQEIAAPKVPVGIMIEVPSAAIRAKDFAELVDFVSLGTNDLTQYVQAADRTNPKVSALAKQNSPAVLDLVAKVCRDLPNTPVAVCGDLASDEEVVATLIEYGVSELSVLPTMVGNIKQAVRNS